MTRGLLGLGLSLGLSLLVACAPIPPPKVLAEVDQVRVAPAVRQAGKDAAAAIAHAEGLRERAHATLADGDFAGAQILGEQALAAYQSAVALARVAAAERIRVAALGDATRADEQLAALDGEHQRIAADIAALEKRLRALRDTEPPGPSGPAKPQRERARVEVVAALQMQARLLCGAARLLVRSHGKGATTPPELGQATSALAALEKLLSSGPAAAPIDHATRVRASCLAALTKVRRANSNSKRATGLADALLTKLSKLGHGTPRRDERGVVLSLRDLFDGDKLSAEGSKTITRLAVVAKAHPRFPMMIVLHLRAPQPKQAPQQQARGRALVAALEKVLGSGVVGKPQLAGAAQPLVARDGRYAHRNERVELIFVAPQAL